MFIGQGLLDNFHIVNDIDVESCPLIYIVSQVTLWQVIIIDTFVINLIVFSLLIKLSNVLICESVSYLRQAEAELQLFLSWTINNVCRVDSVAD